MAKNADLKANAAAKILTGGLSDETLKAIINLPSNGEDLVIRAVDITVSGAVKDHETTNEEVIKYMARSGSNYDQLIAEIKKAKAAKQAKNDKATESSK